MVKWNVSLSRIENQGADSNQRYPDVRRRPKRFCLTESGDLNLSDPFSNVKRQDQDGGSDRMRSYKTLSCREMDICGSSVFEIIL